MTGAGTARQTLTEIVDERGFEGGVAAAFAEPGPNEVGPTSRRQCRIAGGLVGRTHHLGRVVVVAQPVAIAREGVTERTPELDRHGPIALAPQRRFAHADHRPLGAERAVELSRIQQILGVERGLDPPHQFERGFVEHVGDVATAVAATVLAPEDAAVAPHQLGDTGGDRGMQRSIIGVGQVEGGAHVDATDVGMAEHAVGQPCTVEQLSEPGNEGRHLGDRHGTVLDERRRPGRAFGPTDRHPGEQTDRVGSNLPDRRLLVAVEHRRHRRASLPGLDLGRNRRTVEGIACVLQQQDRPIVVADDASEGGPRRGRATPGQRRLVERLDRGRSSLAEPHRVVERRAEVGVGGHDEGDRLGKGLERERRPDDHGKGALGPAKKRDRVDHAVATQAVDAIPAEPPGQLGQVERAGIVDRQIEQTTPQGSARTGPGRPTLGLLDRDRFSGPRGAVGQQDVEPLHVAVGAAVDHRALARCIGGDHSADRRPVEGRRVRCPEEPVGGQRGIELCGDQAGLDDRRPRHGVDLDDPVQLALDIDDDAVGQALAVGTGSAPAGDDRAARTGGVLTQDECDLLHRLGQHHPGRLDLIDRVVGRVDGAGDGIIEYRRRGGSITHEARPVSGPSLGPDPGTQQFDHSVEGLVEIVRARVPVPGFEVAEPVEGRAERSGRVDPVVLVEIEAGESLGDDRDDALDGILEFGIAGTRVAVGGLVEAGMGGHRRTPGPPDRSHCGIAGHTDRGSGE